MVNGIRKRAAGWRNERGIALVLSLLMMMAISVVAASLMFLSQTETYSSTNYRLMSQARYAAEAGVQQAVNYLVYTYATPGGAGDPLANYDMTVSPVAFNNKPVVLSANNGVTANYPIAAVQTAFAAAAAGSVTVGTTTMQYAPSATLVAMRQVNVYGGGTSVVQTWQITSDGTVTQNKTAQVEVTATLNQDVSPAAPYAAFATGGGCGALSFSGPKVYTDSYDSTALVGGNPNLSPSGGSVGTNGNLNDASGSTINGTLSSPRVGVGACSNGNVDALTASGGATVTGGVTQLPAQVVIPPPAVPAGVPTGNVMLHGANTYYPGNYADIRLNAGGSLTLAPNPGTSCPCTFNMNSLVLNGGAALLIPSGPVTLNIVGAGVATPLDLTGGSVTNSAGWNPDSFQILYAGSGNILMNGGAKAVAMVTAPNAAITLAGGADFYGSLIGNTVTDTGGAHIHYDRHLTGMFFTTGNQMLTAFSWKKF
jgi:hypothetical protein